MKGEVGRGEEGSGGGGEGTGRRKESGSNERPALLYCKELGRQLIAFALK